MLRPAIAFVVEVAGWVRKVRDDLAIVGVQGDDSVVRRDVLPSDFIRSPERLVRDVDGSGGRCEGRFGGGCEGRFFPFGVVFVERSPVRVGLDVPAATVEFLWGRTKDGYRRVRWCLSRTLSGAAM